ncbi:MAG: restriction endonuclease subunit S [Thermodesulfovibrionia bacterium]|nr:restriction endonuclease subunit S [Thermodesulfovibrionia bacterium]
MVEAQTKNQSIFWLWSDEIDFQKRGDAIYWSPELVILEKYKNSIPLKQVAAIKGGKRLPLGENFSDDGDVPYIRTRDFTSGYIDYPELKKISEKVFNAIRSYQIHKNDVLISIVGTIGAIAILDKQFERCNFTENAAKIVCSNKLNPYYLYAFLLSQIGQQQFRRLTVGGVQPKLPLYAVEEIKILLPDKQTQQKVEQIVKEAFRLKKEAEADYQKCQQILDDTLGLSGIKKTLQTAFWRWSDEINIIARIDPNYYQSYFQELKASRKKLKTVKLETLASLIDYGTVPTSPDAPPEFGTPYLTGKNIQPNDLVLDKLDYLYTDTTEAIKNKAIKADDVVITQMGTVGNAAVMGKRQEGWFFGSFLIRIRPKKGISPEWLALVINSDFGKQQIQQAMTTASVRTNTDLPTVKGLEMPTIDKKKETQIANLYVQSRDKKVLSKQKLQEAKDFVENLIENK